MTTPPIELRVEGAEKLGILGRSLRRAGNVELRKELYRGLNRAVKPLREVAKRTPLDRPGLPSRGGLSDTVASSLRSRGVRVRRRLGGRNPGISLSGVWSGHDIRALNRGRLRHPVFGNRGVWVTQTIASGFWDKPLEREAPKTRKEVVRVLDELAQQIARSVE